MGKTGKTFKQINDDLLKALSDNSMLVGGWINELGETSPNYAVQLFLKTADTYMKIKEFDDQDSSDGFDITIEVADEESKELLEIITKDNGKFISDFIDSNKQEPDED